MGNCFLHGQSGGGASVLTGDALVGEVLSGKLFYKDDPATQLTGTMVNVGAQTATITTVAGTVTPTQGYHSGAGSISIAAADQTKLITGNILAGVTVLGVVGDANVVNTGSGDAIAAEILASKKAWVDGAEVTGTMVDRIGDTACSSSSVDGTTLKLVASVGYRDGVNDSVSLTDADFTAANIKNAVNIFGLLGTLTVDDLLTDAIVITSREGSLFKALTVDFYGTVVQDSQFYNGSSSSGHWCKMTGITFKSALTALKYRAFYSCDDMLLTELPATLTTIRGSAFQSCKAMTLPVLPAGLTVLETVAFDGCSALTLNALPNGITSLAANTFSGCTSLTVMTMPMVATIAGSSAITGAFYNCTSLATAQVGSTGYPATAIGAYAFTGCAATGTLTVYTSGGGALANSPYGWTGTVTHVAS